MKKKNKVMGCGMSGACTGERRCVLVWGVGKQVLNPVDL